MGAAAIPAVVAPPAAVAGAEVLPAAAAPAGLPAGGARSAFTPRVALGTTMIEPSLHGGHVDGIGVYTRALLRHLPQAGCEVLPLFWPPSWPHSLAHSLVHSLSHSVSQSLSRSLFRSLPRSLSRSSPRSWQHTGGAVPTAGRPMPHSFARAALADLLLPDEHRAHIPADVFHVTDYRVVRMQCPVVASLHDALPLIHPEWCNPRLRGLKNWLQRKAAHRADHVIALSHHAVGELVSGFGIDARRITVVPCGVDAAWLQPPAPAAVAATLAANGLRPGYFLFVGTLQPRKNIERLLDAYLALPESVRAERQLVVVGHAGARAEGTLRRMAAARQRGAGVVWLNRLDDHARLRHVYAGAGVFVFASLYEGFGMPVLEAFASGVPVVASDTTALPEVTAGAAVAVDPLDTGAIAAAMLALVREPALRARCIAAGHARARQLTWTDTARQTAAVYRSLL